MTRAIVYSRLADLFPYSLRRRSSLDWIVPVAIGFGAGAMLGAGFGLLLAPHAGEETRGKLRERARHLRDRARLAARRATRRGIAERVEGAVSEMVHDVSRAAS